MKDSKKNTPTVNRMNQLGSDERFEADLSHALCSLENLTNGAKEISSSTYRHLFLEQVNTLKKRVQELLPFRKAMIHDSKKMEEDNG